MLDSRPNGTTIRRKRECLNMHRFHTLEILDGVGDTRAFQVAHDAISKRQARAARDGKILRDLRAVKIIAETYGLSEVRVRAIKQALKIKSDVQ